MTNEERQALVAFLANLDAASFGAEFENNVNSVKTQLSGIDSHRADVDGFNVSGGSHLAYYTALNASILNSIGGIGGLSPDPALSQMVGGYLNFMQAKERAGIERAVMSGAFAAGSFGEGQFAKFNGLVTAQDAFLGVFVSLATPEQVAYFDTTVSGPAIDAVESMRQTATDNATAESLGGIAAGNWFAQASTRLNLFKNVENRLAEDLVGLSGSLKSDANRSLMTSVIVTVVALVVSVLLAVAVVSPLQARIRGLGSVAAGDVDELEKGLNALAKGDLTYPVHFSGDQRRHWYRP